MCICSKSLAMLKQLNELEAEAAVRAQTDNLSSDPLTTIIHYWPVIVSALRLWEAVRAFLTFFRKKKLMSDVPDRIINAGNSLYNVNKSAE